MALAALATLATLEPEPVVVVITQAQHLTEVQALVPVLFAEETGLTIELLAPTVVQTPEAWVVQFASKLGPTHERAGEAFRSFAALQTLRTQAAMMFTLRRTTEDTRRFTLVATVLAAGVVQTLTDLRLAPFQRRGLGQPVAEPTPRVG